jgi:hypothetical protein
MGTGFFGTLWTIGPESDGKASNLIGTEGKRLNLKQE